MQEKKRGGWGVFFLHTETFPRHWWHSHITDSSSLPSAAAHSMSWFRLSWGDQREKTDVFLQTVGLLSSKHWGAGPQQEKERDDGREIWETPCCKEHSPPPHPMFCMCSRICKNNLWEHLVLIPFLLISCCCMSNCWTKALVYIRSACNRMRLELLPLEFDMRSEQKWGNLSCILFLHTESFSYCVCSV